MKRFSLLGRLAVIVASVAGALLAISAGAVPAVMAGAALLCAALALIVYRARAARPRMSIRTA
jgi:hypothetical protein